MPFYPVYISANRHDALPPVAELSTLEADSPEDALAKLRKEQFVIAGEVPETVWLRVVVSTWPNGNARQVLSTEIQVAKLASEN
jgi:hypothetical protein